MPVLDWFWPFTARHTQRIPLADWPPMESEYWGVVWVGALVKHGVVEGVADDASIALAMAPPKFLPDQLPAFIESVKTVWAMSEVVDGSQNYAAIQAANRGCLMCYGMGMTTRRVVLQSGNRVGMSFYCVCPAGRWLKAEHAKSDGDAGKTVKGRIPDLADYPQLKEPVIEGAREVTEACGLRSAVLDELYGRINPRAAPTRRKPSWATGKPEPNHPATPDRRAERPEAEVVEEAETRRSVNTERI